MRSILILRQNLSAPAVFAHILFSPEANKLMVNCKQAKCNHTSTEGSPETQGGLQALR